MRDNFYGVHSLISPFTSLASLASLARFACSVAIGMATISICSSVSAQDNWPQLRGSDARGTIDGDTQLPDRWSATENVEWKKDIPGRGWSSPVVWGNHVFLTSVVNLGETEEIKKGLYFGGDRPKPPESVHQWKVYCLALDTGDIVWEKTVHEGKPATAIHLKNSFASETAVTDGEHVYAMFGGLGIYCFDMEGTEVWTSPLKPQKTRNGWGTAASPVLHDGRLYVLNDNDEASYLEALDAKTGERVWRVERDEKSNWATPYIWQNETRTEIVTAGTGMVRSYDLDGELLWTLEGMSSITIATPYEYDGLLYISSGYVGDMKSRPIYAIRPGGSDDISLQGKETSNDWIVWSKPKAGPYNPSTIAYKGIVYVLHDFGFFAAFDAKDGSEVYKKVRIPKARGFTSSPWAYDGKVFCLDENGTTHVIKAGKEFEVLHTNKMGDGDMGMATPALVGDRLLIRTDTRIYCLKK